MAIKTAKRGKTNEPEIRPLELKKAMHARVHRRLSSTGEIVVPAVPAMLDTYAEKLAKIFDALGRPFQESELLHLRKILAEKLEEGFGASRQANLLIRYSTDPSPAVSLSYTVTARWSSIEEQYAEWTVTREGALFGKEPDARLIALAATLGPPADVPCLDVGAGTGRNALALARLGHPTDALELAPALADILEKTAATEKLPVRVVRANALVGELPLERGRYKLAIVAEVTSDFRGPAELRTLFERLAMLLAPGGVALSTRSSVTGATRRTSSRASSPTSSGRRRTRRRISRRRWKACRSRSPQMTRSSPTRRRTCQRSRGRRPRGSRTGPGDATFSSCPTPSRRSRCAGSSSSGRDRASLVRNRASLGSFCR